MSKDLFHFPGGKEPKFAKDQHPLRPEAGVKEIASWLRSQSPEIEAAFSQHEAEMASSANDYEFIWIGVRSHGFKAWAKNQFGTPVEDRNALDVGKFSSYANGLRAFRLSKSQGQLAKLKRLDKSEYLVVHDPNSERWNWLWWAFSANKLERGLLPTSNRNWLRKEVNRQVGRLYEIGT